MKRVIKPSILNKLKADKEKKDVEIKELKRFCVKVPGLQAHSNHPSREICGIGQTVDSSITENNS